MSYVFTNAGGAAAHTLHCHDEHEVEVDMIGEIEEGAMGSNDYTSIMYFHPKASKPENQLLRLGRQPSR